MKKKCDKAIRRAYRKGRREGFDHGFNTAKMIFSEIATDLKRQLEELNSELILGEEESDDGGDAEETTFYSDT